MDEAVNDTFYSLGYQGDDEPKQDPMTTITREDFVRQGGSEAEKARLRAEWDAQGISSHD